MDGASRKIGARHQRTQRHHGQNAENGAREHVARVVVSEIYSGQADYERGPDHRRSAEPSRAAPEGNGEGKEQHRVIAGEGAEGIQRLGIDGEGHMEANVR
jgi:hypothetical protein